MQELSDGCGEARRRQVEERLISVQQEMQTAKKEEEEGQENANSWEERLQTLARQQDEGMIALCVIFLYVIHLPLKIHPPPIFVTSCCSLLESMPTLLPRTGKHWTGSGSTRSTVKEV